MNPVIEQALEKSKRNQDPEFGWCVLDFHRHGFEREVELMTELIQAATAIVRKTSAVTAMLISFIPTSMVRLFGGLYLYKQNNGTIIYNYGKARTRTIV